MNKLFQSMRLRRILILCYGILAVIVLSAYVFVHRTDMKVLTEEIHTNQQNSLKIMKEDIDSIFFHFLRCADVAEHNYYAQQLSRFSETATLSQTYPLITEIQDEINDLYLNVEYRADMYIYFPSIDIVVSEKGFVNPNNFYLYNCRNKEISFEQWSNLIKQSNDVPVLMKRNVYDKDASEDFMLIKAFDFDGDGNVDYSLVYFLPNTTIKSYITKYLNEKSGEILIVDADGRLLLKAGSDFEYNPQNWKVSSDEGIYTDGDFSVVFCKAGIKGLYYANVISNEVYYEKLEAQRTVFWILLVFLAAIGVYLLYGVYRYQYSGMKAILNKLGVVKSRENEFKVINDRIMQIYNEKNEMSDSIDLLGEITRDSIFSKFSMNELQLSDLSSDTLKKFGIIFEYKYYAIVGFMYKNTSGKARYYSKYTDRYIKNYRNIEQWLLSEICSFYQEAYSYEYNGCLYIVFNLDKDDCLEFSAVSIEVLKNIKKQEANEGSELYAAVSDIYENDDAIFRAAKDVTRIIDFQNMESDCEIYTLEDLLEIAQGYEKYSYSISNENDIVNAVLSGNTKSAKIIFENIFDKALLSVSGNDLIIECLINDFCGTILKIYEEFTYLKEYRSADVFLANIAGEKSLSKIKCIFLEEIETLCEFSRGRKDSRMIEDEIESFIIENYADDRMSVQFVAAHFELNPVYISNMYKLKKNIGILQLITKCRMEEAKRLIEAGEKISEAAAKVGYMQTQTFTRAFKKYYGLKPSDIKNDKEEKK